MRLAIAALLVGALAGCSEGSYGEQEKWVKGDLARFFAELNAEAGARVQDAKATANDSEIPDTSLVIDRYDWSADGSVYSNVECPNGACKAKIGALPVFSAEPGSARCPACNTDLGAELASKAKPMFEVKSTSAPLVVVVRYVHRSMALDSSSAVMVSSKTEQAVMLKQWTETRQPGFYYAGGFYREVHSTLGTTGFVYRGGLQPVDRESVKKMTADPPETVPPSSLKTRGWDPIEVPLFRWLGRAPSVKPKEAPKAD